MWGLDNISIEINKSCCPTFCDCKVPKLKTQPKGQDDLEQT